MKHDSLQHPEQYQDPMEAIYALNIGDFVAESFISEDLLDKISHRLADDPQKLKAQLEELVHIYSMDKTMGILGFDNQSGFVIYDSIAATLANMFQVDACHLFQSAAKDSGENTLTLTGTSRELAQRWDIGIQIREADLMSDAFNSREPVMVRNLDAVPDWHPIPRLDQEKAKALLATPLREGSKKLGLLVLESYEAQGFSEEQVALAQATAQVFVTGIRLQQLVAEAQHLILQPGADSNKLLNMRAQVTESIADLGIHQQAFVETLSNAIDARHHFTKGHSIFVGELAQTLAEAMQLNEKTVDLVYYAGLMGSLGKIHIPSDVLNKQGALSTDEWENLKNHPNVGVGLLVKINFLSEVVPYVHYQNERWDGSGGPEGLKGRSIPLGSRILAVANAYYAMTQERPYRGEPLTHAQALETLQREAGVKWDPAVVETLAKIPRDSFR